MRYTIYENRPRRRHFTVNCLQWSITFLTEYITSFECQNAILFFVIRYLLFVFGFSTFGLRPNIKFLMSKI